MIVALTFEQILPYWQKLWPSRESPIESHSTMLLNGRSIGNFDQPVFFYALQTDDKIVGVNSVHRCTDGSFRSRGLWVEPTARGNGYGLSLLQEGIKIGFAHGTTKVWSYPRKSSWPTYEKAGFELTSEWEASETSDANAYCALYQNA